MSSGPLDLLYTLCMNGADYGSISLPLWATLSRHPGAPLLIQRFNRLASRETIGTPDGLASGKYARAILSKFMSEMFLDLLFLPLKLIFRSNPVSQLGLCMMKIKKRAILN